MATAPTPSPDIPTVATLLDRLGGVAPSRVRFFPTPGSATEHDVVALEATENRLFELVDGVLVEKPKGFRESYLAGLIVTALNTFVRPRGLGIVTGPDGMLRLLSGLVRIPDVAFISTARLPGGRLPRETVPAVVPDIAVEVVSRANTPAEMARKRAEYFAAGVVIVWHVDADTRTVTVFTSPETGIELGEADVLTAPGVLDGFALPLADLFRDLPPDDARA